MKIKIVFFLSIAAFLVVILFLYMPSQKPIQDKIENNKVLKKTTQVSRRIIEKKMKDIQVIAKSDKETEKLASEFYNDLFSISSADNKITYDVVAGKGISVYNFFDVNKKYSQFVPLHSNSKVVAVSIFREYKEGEKELSRMVEVNKDWLSYPPITQYDAEIALHDSYPELLYKNVPGYFYIEDGEIPYYLYEENDLDLGKYYLVSSYTGDVVIKKNRETDAPEDNVPVIINLDGYMEVDETMTKSFSEEELKKLREDIELTNRYIEDGIMKFDKNMNVVFDKRQEQENN